MKKENLRLQSCPSASARLTSFPELKPFEYTPKSSLETGFGEDKKGLVAICSACGTPLNKDGHCPNGCQ
jgi:hypothetical protein